MSERTNAATPEAVVLTLRPFFSDVDPIVEMQELRKVVVVGAGGIGARVLPTLVKILPKQKCEVVVIDGDLVEPKNLQRQPFDREDVGMFKAQIMQERYSTEDLPVTAVCEYLAFEPYGAARDHLARSLPIFDHTIVLGCVDNTKTRYQILNWLYNSSAKPWIYLDAGNDGNRGQVIVAGAYAACRPLQANPDAVPYRTRQIIGASKFPEIFDPADPKREGCDLLDTQMPITNQMAATLLLQYLSLFLNGQTLGSIGATFSTLGARDLLPLHRMSIDGNQHYGGIAVRDNPTGKDYGYYTIETELRRFADLSYHRQAAEAAGIQPETPASPFVPSDGEEPPAGIEPDEDDPVASDAEFEAEAEDDVEPEEEPDI